MSESLNQSVMERKDLLEQIDHFKDEISQLQEQLQETTQMVVNHKCIPTDDADNCDNVKIIQLSEAPDVNIFFTKQRSIRFNHEITIFVVT